MTAGRQVNTLSQEWCTPDKYVKAINNFFNNIIDLDPCSNDGSIIESKTKYTLPEKDGLKEKWNFKNIYVNPPYGRDTERGTTIKRWIEKCEESNRIYGSEVLALIPVATNTSHWKEFIYNKASAICFLHDTRLKFRIDGDENNKGCPMACCMIYWGKDVGKFISIFSEFGFAVISR